MSEAVNINVPVFSKDLVRVTDLSLSARVFGGPTRPHLLHETVRMQQANRRRGTSSVKTRGVVRGGGRKPWRQKGSGRARAGSNRSPLWEGGAVVFGPQPRNHGYRLPRSARRAALRAVLSEKVRSDSLIVVEAISLPEAKTKRAVEWLRSLGVEGSTLIVIPVADRYVELAGRNLPNLKVIKVDGLNVYDLLRYANLVIAKDAVTKIEERLI